MSDYSQMMERVRALEIENAALKARIARCGETACPPLSLKLSDGSDVVIGPTHTEDSEAR